MNMKKGYQLVEIETLEKLIQVNIEVETQIAIISWTIFCLQQDTDIQKLPIEVAFVAANYNGKFPCIGIHYLDVSANDVSHLIEEKCQNVYLTKKPIEFLQYLIEHKSAVEENLIHFQKQ